LPTGCAVTAVVVIKGAVAEPPFLVVVTAVVVGNVSLENQLRNQNRKIDKTNRKSNTVKSPAH
jgi:hypothetical protein